MAGGYGKVGKGTRDPNNIIGAQIQAEREDQWGEMPGEVVSFDKSTQTITARPLYKKRLNGQPTQLPDLLEIPVRFPRMGGFVMTTPVKPGDKITLRPQMRNTEEYHAGGGAFAAADTRSFNLSDYEAFMDGGESLSDPIPNFNNSNLEIRSADGKHKIEMSEDGKFRIEGGQGNVYDLLAQVVELLAADTLLIKHGSSSGSGHSLQFQEQYAELAGKLRAMSL